MRRVCAWCKKDIGSNEVYAVEGDITHGICSLCAIKVTNFKMRTAGEILDVLQEPIFIIDSEGRVKGTNKSGKKMLGKDFDKIEDQLGGDAFECSYSKLDGGCGKTEHCKTCAIRNIVMDTLSTGQGYKDVPAFQSIKTSAGTRKIKFHISTERVENYILLRVDSVTDSTA